METVTISAILSNKKKAEFFQTMEPLEILVKTKCENYKFLYEQDGLLIIEVLFKNQEQLKENFYQREFNILKGTLKSLCQDVNIQISN